MRGVPRVKTVNPTNSSVDVGLWAGAAKADLTPQRSMFLFGYPHVPRYSTGMHDPLECAALYLRSGAGQALILANDLIFFSRDFVADVRRRIEQRTGVPAGAIAITATHTHSGPMTVNHISNEADPVVPKADPAYLHWIAEQMTEAGCAAVAAAQPAAAGTGLARAEGVGTNRHDPAGPADPEVPVLLVRSRRDGRAIGCMVAYAMHPTVLHEDSTLISGDFPHFTRRYLLEQGLLPDSCVILYHNGASGNQSPRHVAKANTFAEARRLGELLGSSIASILPTLTTTAEVRIAAHSASVPLSRRQLPPLDQAERAANEARRRHHELKQSGAPRAAVRTAECDCFGADETVALARAQAENRLAAVAATCSPAEIQVIGIGADRWVFWPGEFFVEYGLAVKARRPRTHVVTLANGETQGYIVTAEAAASGGYEAANAVFSPDNGRVFVERTLELLAESDKA